jgi:PAS domain S-box-containing protein
MAEKPTYEELERRVQELKTDYSELEKKLVLTDIAKSKRLEEEWRESEFQKELILNATSELVAYYDTDLRIKWVNKAAAASVGKRPEEMIGSYCYTFWNHIDEPCFDCPVIKARDEKISHEIEKRTLDGRHWNIRGFPILKEDKVIGLAEFTLDITDRKRTEKKLQKSEERFRNLYDEAPVGYFEYDLLGNITRVNHTELEMLGYTAEEMIGQRCWEFIVDEVAREQIMAKLRGIRPPAIGLERTYRRKDGTTFPVLFEDRLLTNEKGHIKGIRTAIQDITDHKLMEESLRDKEAWLSETMRSAGVGGWKIDLMGNTLKWTDETFRIHELPTGDPPNVAEAIQFYHAEDRPRVSASVQHAIENGEGFDFKARIITTKQNLIWVRSIGHVSFHKGKIAKVWGTIQDITDRKRGEEALRKSEQEKSMILDNVGNIIAYHDKNGDIVWVNQLYLDSISYITGSSVQMADVKGRRCYELWKLEKPCVGCPVAITLQNGNTTEAELSPENQPHWPATQGAWYIKATPIRDTQDNVIGAIEIAIDITDRKRTEEQSEKLQDQLQQAQKMESIGSLAGGIAHDFNNLLFPIVGLSEMMLETFPPGSPEHHDAQQICKAGKRGRELVQQILSFSRQSEKHLIPVHIQKILKEVFKLCRATIPADIPITREIQTDCRPVMADPTQIHQIAMNLITNAYHAVEPTGGSISIQLKEITYSQDDNPADQLESGAYAMLSVSDTGTGIDPAILDKIFDPYFTTKEKGRGTGLGLATVYGIVKAHGGDIRVYSEVGEGACFHVYLPVLEKPETIDTHKQRQTIPKGTEHILLVDDEPSIVHLEKQMLERLGYCITSFTGSKDALAAFETDPTQFDLVITDMHMPKLTGVQLAKKMIAVRPAIPVILCTGFSESIDKEKTESLGIKGLLMKPVGMMDLAHKVREVIDLG